MTDRDDTEATTFPADATGDATAQVAPGDATASPMGSSGLSGGGSGAFGSGAELVGEAQSSAGAVSATGRRMRMRFPAAPGGSASPQIPGATPDFSTIPGERVARSPRVSTPRHPLSQAGTAEGIMGFHDAAPGAENDPERFELGLTSFEEQRKSTPALRTPVRPERTATGLGDAAWQRPSLGAGDAALPPITADPESTRDQG